MLDTLDELDWHNLRHSYGSADDTPIHIRNLLSDNENDRNDAFKHLYWAVNHQGDIGNATVAVVPFLIELIASEITPERHRIIEVLASFIDSCSEHLLRVKYSLREFSISYFRYEMQVAIKVEDGIPIFIALIDHPEAKIRNATIKLLGRFVSHGDTILPKLLQQVRREQDEDILQTILQSVTTILEYAEINFDKKQYFEYLNNIVANHKNYTLRLEASKALIMVRPFEGFSRSRTVPVMVTDTLVHALEYPLTYNLSPISFDYIVLEPLLSLGILGMAQALNSQHIRPYSAHIIARNMLYVVFNEEIPLIKNIFFDWKKYEDRSSRIYSEGTGVNHYVTYHVDLSINQYQRNVIKYILDCEPFWKMETNLFSFFFDLPDDRNELEKLVKISD